MGGNATQALKEYAVMTGTFWCAKRSNPLILQPTSPYLSSRRCTPSSTPSPPFQGQQLLVAARPQVRARHVRQVLGSDPVGLVDVCWLPRSCTLFSFTRCHLCGINSRPYAYFIYFPARLSSPKSIQNTVGLVLKVVVDAAALVAPSLRKQRLHQLRYRGVGLIHEEPAVRVTDTDSAASVSHARRMHKVMHSHARDVYRDVNAWQLNGRTSRRSHQPRADRA